MYVVVKLGFVPVHVCEKGGVGSCVCLHVGVSVAILVLSIYSHMAVSSTCMHVHGDVHLEYSIYLKVLKTTIRNLALFGLVVID